MVLVTHFSGSRNSQSNNFSFREKPHQELHIVCCLRWCSNLTVQKNLNSKLKGIETFVKLVSVLNARVHGRYIAEFVELGRCPVRGSRLISSILRPLRKLLCRKQFVELPFMIFVLMKLVRNLICWSYPRLLWSECSRQCLVSKVAIIGQFQTNCFSGSDVV